MRWVTKVSCDNVFVLDTTDWLEHKCTTNMALRLKDVFGVDNGTISPCFSYYRWYYGFHYITIKGIHLFLKFTPTDIILVKVKGNLENKTLVIPSIVTQIRKTAFYDIKIRSLDISRFDTSTITNMAYMFRNCKAEELNVSHFDTSKVTDMRFMFCDCQAKELDVSHFDTSNVKDFSHMFLGYEGIIIGKEKFPEEAFV